MEALLRPRPCSYGTYYKTSTTRCAASRAPSADAAREGIIAGPIEGILPPGFQPSKKLPTSTCEACPFAALCCASATRARARQQDAAFERLSSLARQAGFMPPFLRPREVSATRRFGSYVARTDSMHVVSNLNM